MNHKIIEYYIKFENLYYHHNNNVLLCNQYVIFENLTYQNTFNKLDKLIYKFVLLEIAFKRVYR